MMTPHEIVKPWLNAGVSPVKSEEQFAPSNIALCKYWGKRDKLLNLPINPSLSVSLAHLGTHTCLTPIDHDEDEVWLNGLCLSEDSAFSKRVSLFLDLFRQSKPTHFKVETRNSIPTAAGLASSASGFAALALAVNDSFQLHLDAQQLSVLARLGSGSACRSLFDGFVEWQMGERADGLDSYATPLSETWSGLCIGLVKVDAREKATDSRSGMQRTLETAHLYQSWPIQAAMDIQAIKDAISAHDFEGLGAKAEHNAMSMHATMMASWPPLVYWQPESLMAMQTIWKLRAQGLPVYFTMDAGPNLKLLFERASADDVLAHFPDIEVIHPFGLI